MNFRARAAAVAREPGAVHIGFEFAGSGPAHLILSFPDGSEDAADLFEGMSHYVELGDQLYGRDDGVACAWIDDPTHFRLLLSFDAGIAGRELSVSLEEPMSEKIMALMTQLPGPAA